MTSYLFKFVCVFKLNTLSNYYDVLTHKSILNCDRYKISKIVVVFVSPSKICKRTHLINRMSNASIVRGWNISTCLFLFCSKQDIMLTYSCCCQWISLFVAGTFDIVYFFHSLNALLCMFSILLIYAHDFITMPFAFVLRHLSYPYLIETLRCCFESRSIFNG